RMTLGGGMVSLSITPLRHSNSISMTMPATRNRRTHAARFICVARSLLSLRVPYRPLADRPWLKRATQYRKHLARLRERSPSEVRRVRVASFLLGAQRRGNLGPVR